MSNPVPPPESEKQGNTEWVQCPKCATDFPVTPALFHSGSYDFHCPVCHHEFRSSG